MVSASRVFHWHELIPNNFFQLCSSPWWVRWKCRALLEHQEAQSNLPLTGGRGVKMLSQLTPNILFTQSVPVILSLISVELTRGVWVNIAGFSFPGFLPYCKPQHFCLLCHLSLNLWKRIFPVIIAILITSTNWDSLISPIGLFNPFKHPKNLLMKVTATCSVCDCRS